MKKIFSLLSIIMLCFILVGCSEKKENSEKEKENVDKGIKYDSYLFQGKEYNSLSEIDPTLFIEYANRASYLFVEKNYENFTDEDIAVYVAHTLLMTEQTATEDEIQELVKNFFGKDNYELKAGEYSHTNKYFEQPFKDNKIIIKKEGNIYKSNLLGSGIPFPTNYLPKVTTTNDRVIIKYNFGQHGMSTSEVISIQGYTSIEFLYKNESLIIDKITYEKKAN